MTTIGVTYRGYATHDVAEAARLYEARTGHAPTCIVVRPGYAVQGTHPALVVSRHAAANMILATHLQNRAEIAE